MKTLILVLLGVAAVSAKSYFKETFDDNSWEDRWVQSSWKSDLGKFKVQSPSRWVVDEKLERGLKVDEDAKFYAISSKFDPFTNRDEDLVLQFSVKNDMDTSSFCRGAYIKLLPESTDQSKFGGDSDYFIMFGPDNCGYDVQKIQLIFNYKGKNLLKNSDIKLNYNEKDDKTHLYTLVVKPDNTYQVFFDQTEKAMGTLAADFDFPAEMIADPTHVKPENWVEEEFMDDPNAEKPDDWDVPPMIPDPEAKIPEDWDEEDDGEWEAPMISNPAYKGEWTPTQIKNPDYKGPWDQKMIPNPEYDDKIYLYENIGVVGFELWVVNSGSIFDNIYIGNSYDEAVKMAEETWGKIQPKEEAAKEKWNQEKESNKEDEKATVDLDGDDDDVEEKEEL